MHLPEYKVRRSSIFKGQYIISDIIKLVLDFEMLIWEPPVDVEAICKLIDLYSILVEYYDSIFFHEKCNFYQQRMKFLLQIPHIDQALSNGIPEKNIRKKSLLIMAINQELQHKINTSSFNHEVRNKLINNELKLQQSEIQTRYYKKVK